MGWFEHGSTILVFAPDGFSLCDSIEPGATIRTGQGLMAIPGLNVQQVSTPGP
jgi:phosphatidylserine decarboxylase